MISTWNRQSSYNLSLPVFRPFPLVVRNIYYLYASAILCLIRHPDHPVNQQSSTYTKIQDWNNNLHAKCYKVTLNRGYLRCEFILDSVHYLSEFSLWGI